MMGNAAYDIQLCIDCVLADAGVPDEHYGTEWTGFYEQWDTFAFAPQMDDDTGEPKEPHFGKAPCDGCGTGLGGDRFDYVAVEVHV